MEIIIISIRVSVLILLTPIFFMYRPPKSINGLYGYRTPRSMSNQTNWDLAQNYWPKVLLKLSIFNVVSQWVLYFFIGLIPALMIALGFWLINFLITIMKTESYLKNQ